MAILLIGGTAWIILIGPNQEVGYSNFGINADAAIEYLVRETARFAPVEFDRHGIGNESLIKG